jgi:PEP-CTERM motif
MLATGACMAAAVTLSFSLMGVTGNDLAQAAAAQAQSLSDLLNGRSPGERTAAQLTKTKHSKQRVFALAPPDRLAASPPLTRKPGQVTQLLTVPSTPIDVAPPTQGIPPNVPTLSEIVGGGSAPGGTGSSPGGGGGPVSFPASEPRQPVTPVSAVPEPNTWATMLLGFGLLGWRLRRRPKSTEKKSAA